jgi:hypothetical protein
MSDFASAEDYEEQMDAIVGEVEKAYAMNNETAPQQQLPKGATDAKGKDGGKSNSNNKRGKQDKNISGGGGKGKGKPAQNRR